MKVIEMHVLFTYRTAKCQWFQCIGAASLPWSYRLGSLPFCSRNKEVMIIEYIRTHSLHMFFLLVHPSLATFKSIIVGIPLFLFTLDNIRPVLASELKKINGLRALWMTTSIVHPQYNPRQHHHPSWDKPNKNPLLVLGIQGRHAPGVPLDGLDGGVVQGLLPQGPPLVRGPGRRQLGHLAAPLAAGLLHVVHPHQEAVVHDLEALQQLRERGSVCHVTFRRLISKYELVCYPL